MTQQMTHPPISRSWILLLALLTAIAPLSTDMYLPALPIMAQEFGVSTLWVSSSLPAYFLGLAIGQLIYGPISDQIGRKKPLIFGLSLHIVASLFCIFADDLNSLLIARVLQALGSCVGLVLARAAIRDVLDTQHAAKAFASMMIVMGVAPVIAPILGAGLLAFFHWHAIFIALMGLGVLSLIWVILGFKESLAVERRLVLSFSNVFGLYGKIFKYASFRYPMLAGCFSFGILFCYINSASTVLMEHYGFSEQQFACAFGVNAVGSMCFAAMNYPLEKRFSILQRLALGGGIQVLGIGLLLVASLFEQVSLVLLLIGLFLAVSGIGLTAPNSTALAMSEQGRHAGSASALMGSLQFFFGLMSGIFINILWWSAQFNMAMTMLLFISCAMLAIWAAHRHTLVLSNV